MNEEMFELLKYDLVEPDLSKILPSEIGEDMFLDSNDEEDSEESGGEQETDQVLEEMLRRKSRHARRIVEFFMAEYPDRIPLMLIDGSLEEILDARLEEAFEYAAEMHPKLQKRENVNDMGMDTLKRIQTEYQIDAEIQEFIDQEIYFRPLLPD